MAQRKAEREIAGFRRYQELSRTLIETNEKICRAQPVEDTITPQEKTAEAVRQEVVREVDQLLNVFFAGVRRTGSLDLEAIEVATRAAMHRAGAGALNHLLNEAGPVPATVAGGCGQSARYHEKRSRKLLTVVGPVQFGRAYYYHCASSCHHGQSPRDRELDVVDTDYSPGVRRMMAVVGSDASFDQGREQMKLLVDLQVTRKAVERHAEAIGSDIERREQTAIQRAVQLDLPNDRHRGSGCPLTPATPPCVRVRTRRFEKLRRYPSTSEGRPSDLK